MDRDGRRDAALLFHSAPSFLLCFTAGSKPFHDETLFSVALYLFFGLTLFDVMDAMTGVSFQDLFFISFKI